MESKQDPSWTDTNENPALESRRVRTQPCMVTLAPLGKFPLSAFFILTADMLWLISVGKAQDNKSSRAMGTVFLAQRHQILPESDLYEYSVK